MRPLRFALLTLLLAACASDGEPPQPSGPWRPLNAGRWAPTDQDLRDPRAAAAVPPPPRAETAP